MKNPSGDPLSRMEKDGVDMHLQNQCDKFMVKTLFFCIKCSAILVWSYNPTSIVFFYCMDCICPPPNYNLHL